MARDIRQTYLLVPEKHKDERKGNNIVIKLGIHKDSSLQRVKSYGGGSQILKIDAVNDCLLVERELKAKFRAKFEQYGNTNEYFWCSINEALETYNKVLQDFQYTKEEKVVLLCSEPLKKPYIFCCKMYCHKSCYFIHLLKSISRKYGQYHIFCPDCYKQYELKTLFVAQKMNKFEGELEFSHRTLDTRKEKLKKLLYLYETQKLDNDYDYDYLYQEKGYNVEEFKEYIMPEIPHNINFYDDYLFLKTHILSGPVREGGMYGCHGGVWICGTDKKPTMMSEYRMLIGRAQYFILVINDKYDCFGSLVELGIAVASGKRIIIIFDDKLEFNGDLIVDNLEYLYKEFWYIWTYNNILREDEAYLLLLFPVIRDKFLDYEQYRFAMKYYSDIMVKHIEHRK